GYQALPSGTMGVAGAVVAVVWRRHPPFRIPTAIVFGLTAFALAITNSHWVADTIAGAFLGVWIGSLTVALLMARGTAP
ncbi:MAG TPA: hypothetical protein VGI83_04180, partial [Gemmatimonadales bacterium]